MQSNREEICKITSQRTGKEEQVYKDIWNFVFKQAASMLSDPKSLIIKLKGVGSWYLRKRRMEIVVSEFTEFEDRPREEFDTDYGYNSYLERKIRYNVFVERLKDYEKYLVIRKEVREKRNEQSYLLTSTVNEGKYKSN